MTPRTPRSGSARAGTTRPRRVPLAAAGLLSLAGCRAFGVVAVVDHDPGAPEAPAPDAGPRRDAATPPDATPPAASSDAPKILDECGDGNPAGLSATQLRNLLDAPGREPTQRFLYPYEGTVFPADMSAPLVMWEGPSSDAVLLHLRSKHVEYSGCLKPSAPGRVPIPQRAWDALAATASGADDPIELRLTTLLGERASGPLSRTFLIAPGNFPGPLYFMSYAATGTTSIWRLRPHESAKPLFSAVDCSGCHTLSANGARLIGYARGTGAAYRLTAGTLIDPEALPARLTSAENAALSPDGALYVNSARVLGVGPRFMGPYQSASGLYEVATGDLVSNSQLPSGITVPMFSPDGTLLAFNDFAIDSGRGLAVMDFDASSRSASHYRELFRDTTHYPAWPSFLPNQRAVVFARGLAPDFSAQGAHLPARTQRGPESDLHLVDVQTGKSTALWRTMGFVRADAADADTYLPFGAEDLHQSYYPNVSPLTSGGYAWVFFDSIRNYGNQGTLRQIWGAALDLSSTDPDPSHPAFYVMGQDLTTTNLHAVASSEPPR